MKYTIQRTFSQEDSFDNVISEIELRATYEYIRGTPPIDHPLYGPQSGDPPEIEIIKIEVEKHAYPKPIEWVNLDAEGRIDD